MIKIITWNILSPFYCDGSGYYGYDPEVLNADNRRKKVFEILSVFISQKEMPIICLQEVPIDWRGDLETFFYNNDYTIFSIGYGVKKSGFFGISTVIPNEYRMERVDYIQVGKYIDASRGNKEINSLVRKGKNKRNVSIRLLLNKDFPFYLYNYHMPLSSIELQILHVDALKKMISLHGDVPTIWAMDSNLISGQEGYKYLTEGIITNKLGSFFDKIDESKLKSSYKEVNKSEPDYTNYSVSKIGGNFKETIDYILITDHFKVKSSKVLLKTGEKCPNRICPSDHLPLESILEKKYYRK